MSPVVPYAAEAVRRNLGGVMKLIIDDRIPMRNSVFGRNLMAGVPNTCKTVKDFKTHLSKVYLQTSAPFLLFLDEFCIPDDEDSGLLGLLSEPVRVVPVGEFGNSGPSIPSSIHRSATPMKPQQFPKFNIVPTTSQSEPPRVKKLRFDTSTPYWKNDSSSSKSKSKNKSNDREQTLSPEIFTGNGVDQIDHDILQCTILNESPIPSPTKRPLSLSESSDSEVSRLTASAKRRLRLRKALEKELEFSRNSSLMSECHSEKITPEVNEVEPAVTPISRKQTKGKEQAKTTQQQQATKSHNRNSFSISDSLEQLAKMTPMYGTNTTPTTMKKRPSTTKMESPPSKLEKTFKTPPNIPSQVVRREDTPRMPKSLKNPAALEIFKRLEFSSDRSPSKTPKKGNSRGASYLQDTFQKLVQNLEADSDVRDTETELKKPEAEVLTTTTNESVEEKDVGRQETENTVPETSNGNVAVGVGAYKYDDDDSQGAMGPLDPLYYETLTPLLSIDDVSENSIVAFKHLEMDENSQARVSEYKEALVTGKSDSNLNLDYLKTSSTVRSEKFDIEGYPTEDLQNPSTISFSLLIGPKLVRGPEIEDGSG